ncbi:MAG TPA: DegV family protein [Negativicutes bacterium]|nr:DegV family protein [Negativicutes bacterium]
MTTLLITDSTAYLPDFIIKEYNIAVVPLNMHLPELDFKEGEGMSNREYYEYLKNHRVFPTTSQPAAGEFLELFQQLEPGDEALVILISSKLSGTVQSAQLACSLLPGNHPPVTIIDSLSAATGLGFQVIRAAEMLAEGIPIKEIQTEIEAMRAQMQIYLMVDDLEYLIRGGRIGKLSGRLANVLKLKPILTVKDGEIVLFDKVRTTGKALQRIIDELEKHRHDLHKICVLHVDALENVRRLHTRIQSEFPVPVDLGEVGPVVGTHAGPGCLAIIFY